MSSTPVSLLVSDQTYNQMRTDPIGNFTHIAGFRLIIYNSAMNIPLLLLQTASILTSFGTGLINTAAFYQTGELWRKKYARFFYCMSLYLFSDYLASLFSRTGGYAWKSLPVTLCFALFVTAGLLCLPLLLRLYPYAVLFALDKKKTKIIAVMVSVTILTAVIALVFRFRYFSIILCAVMLSVSALGTLLFYIQGRRSKNKGPKELILFLYVIFTAIPFEFIEYGIKLGVYGHDPFPIELIVTPLCITCLGIISIKGTLAFLKNNRTGQTEKEIPVKLKDRFNLTPRENDVAVQLVEGKTSKEIAAMLFISRRTVDRHVENIYRKSDTHSRAQFITTVLRKG